jgi:hypothetical protein
MRNMYTVSVGKIYEKRFFGDLGTHWRINVNWFLDKYIGKMWIACN